MKDLAIAGGGPVGLAAAILAARAGLAVEIYEPRSGVIDKACGEGIPPAGVRALAGLGVRPPGVLFPGIRYVDALDPERAAAGRYAGAPGLGVRRTALHAALREAALSHGIVFRPERLTDATRAGFTLGADGLGSTIARLVDPAPLRRGRLGIRRHYRCAAWTDHVEVHFADGAEAYVTPVGPDLVGIAFLFRALPDGEGGLGGGEGVFDRLLARFPRLGERLRGAAPASRTRGAGPFERRLVRQARGPVLLVGDAAGYVDPLTGDGIALGLRTAALAVDGIVRGETAAYTARYRALVRPHVLATRALRAVAEHRALHPLLLEGARLLPALFDGALALLDGAAEGPRAALPQGSMTSAAKRSTW